MSILGIPFRMRGDSGPGYIINNAVWFDGVADYLKKTFSSAGNRKTATLSVWLKRNSSSGRDTIFSAGTPGTGRDWFVFDYTNFTGINVRFDDSAKGDLISTADYLDPTAWYHLVAAIDVTQATASDRVNIYINGVPVSSFSTETYPANVNQRFNSADVHEIGKATSNAHYFDGYMAEFIWIDGTQYAATDFGEFDANGVWAPIDPSELTFGTHGFWLDFAVAPGTGNGTGNGAGTDVSGNGNHFTDVSMTAAQQVADSPTDDADNNAGNYCTWNPLDIHPSYVPAFARGNLDATGGAPTAYTQIRGTIGASSGRKVFEVTPGSTLTYGANVGIIRASDLQNVPTAGAGTKGILARSDLYGGLIYIDGTVVQSSIGGWGYGDVMRVEVDFDNGTVDFFKNGASWGPQVTGLTLNDQPWVPTWIPFGSYKGTIECGQGGFAGTPTNGYLEWHTGNLAAPATAASVTPITSPSFTGNANADGPFIWLGYTPDTAGTSTINGNTITWGAHARATAGGFKIITSSTSYNSTGTNTISIAVEAPFGGAGVAQARAR